MLYESVRSVHSSVPVVVRLFETKFCRLFLKKYFNHGSSFTIIKFIVTPVSFPDSSRVGHHDHR